LRAYVLDSRNHSHRSYSFCCVRLGQDAVSPKLDAANGGDAAYSNECLALVYRLPDGWNFARFTQARTGHQSNQKMILFRVQRDSAAASAESLQLDVLKPPLEHPNMERFTILLALSFVHGDSAKNKITRNAYPVTIAGRSFFRSDLRSGDKALSLFATWYRGYAVIASELLSVSIQRIRLGAPGRGVPGSS
jgi:hypothetical protein